MNLRTKAVPLAAFLLCSLISVVSFESKATILPPNNLWMEDSGFEANITQEQFNKIIDGVIDIWKPLAEARGAKLTVNKRWDDSTVNASANQVGNSWVVNMYGGLARRPEVTQDAFALVVCHELGHHFAGYYFYGSDDWAASEGQSDYWATQVCGRYIWRQTYFKNPRYFTDAPKEIKDACDKVWKEPVTQALCYRTTAAGISLATLLGRGKVVKVNTPDTSTVRSTNVNHPQAQCRLDTYFAGATCPAAADLRVIPGKDLSDQNSIEGEQIAAKYSCLNPTQFQSGFRPRCWFKPLSAEFSMN
jgi:hypothetical protein